MTFLAVAEHHDERATVKARLEAEHGKPLLNILLDAINEAGSVRGAARKLNCSPYAVQYWTNRYNITLRTVALAPLR